MMRKILESRRDEVGYVYLISTTGKENMNANGTYKCKIGRTRDHPIGRLKSLQTGCPDKLFLLGYVHCFRYLELEVFLHGQYASANIHGEWFSLTLDQIHEIMIKYHLADDLQQIEEIKNLIRDSVKDAVREGKLPELVRDLKVEIRKDLLDELIVMMNKLKILTNTPS